ncbi:MAG: sigma-70 family RNA polymerase sigma factor, partial [Chloroflexota bacterium]|nr:sigma-70 family RNA polymerase sigma factor [Chloroflexota bacterium]
FSAWLYRIAHNMVVNWYRDKAKIDEIPLDDEIPLVSTQDHVEEHLQKTEEEENLLAIIRELSEDRQQVLILKFVEGLTNKEIGDIMGRTEGAIKALYHRILVSLRDEYGV